MSLATDILKKMQEIPPQKIKKTRREYKPRKVAEGFVMTSTGPMRLKKDGTVDGRNLARGKSGQTKHRATCRRSYEHTLLRDIFEAAKPGEEYEWQWRNEKTYDDLKLRGAQITYARKIANIYGHKVSIFAKKKHMVIKYVSTVED